MTLSPFARDLGERAAKTLTGALASYWFETWLNTLVALSPLDRGLIFAAGTTGCSIAWSLISRRFGRRGTASLTKPVEYASGAAAP